MRLLLLALLWLPGCFVAADIVRARAAKDLGCPEQQISVYDAADDATVARGCGAWVQYQCFSTKTRVVCVRESPAQVDAAPPAPPPASASSPASPSPTASANATPARAGWDGAWSR